LGILLIFHTYIFGQKRLGPAQKPVEIENVRSTSTKLKAIKASLCGVDDKQNEVHIIVWITQCSTVKTCTKNL